MTIADDILFLLEEHPEGLDDDEIASLLHLSKRQTANQVARRLAENGKIRRIHSGSKLRNFALRTLGVATARSRTTPNTLQARHIDRPWHWEGNVQTAVAEQLRDEGWTIHFTADTATRQRGKDIEATRGERRLWVTVKGYPEGTGTANPPTQARHWFSHALFDVLLYRGEDPDVELAVALPDFPTYRALAKRVQWLERVAPFSYYWIPSPS